MPTSKRRKHEKLLDNLARVAVYVGVRPAEGQQIILSAPMVARPLVRLITKHAYQAGASFVTTLYDDDPCTVARYKYAPDGSFDQSTDWLFEGMASAFGKHNVARMAISASSPGLLAEFDSEKVSRSTQARGRAYTPAAKFISASAINWNIVSCANPAWAKKVFPGLPQAEAMEKLWAAIFAASRADLDDPIAAWAEHNAKLQERKDFLNGKRFAALKYTGPGTDLTIGLADDHEWAGGQTLASNGVYCNPNIPTEEVFTTPHKMRVDGYVTSSKPLSLNGSVVENIFTRFEGGRIVEVKADAGQDVFEKHIQTDEGASRLGEVALVPHSSPISQSGLIFFNTLYDENAASHIAVGRSYAKCIRGGQSMTEEELGKQGANYSDVHTDWMIGSCEMDIDGVHQDGSTEPLMRKGEWV